MKKLILIVSVATIIIAGFLLFNAIVRPGQKNEPILGNQVTDNGKPPFLDTQNNAVQKTEEMIIEINNFAFIPANLEISVGTKVTWQNLDSAPHNIASNPDKSIFSSLVLNKGDSYSFVFSTPGEYDYICAIHPSMSGKIIVE